MTPVKGIKALEMECIVAIQIPCFAQDYYTKHSNNCNFMFRYEVIYHTLTDVY